MEHTEIAPLARRLAEENNVEWRRLQGSGERGRVVERDVLEYLARVMAGDEDLDPTPEPVPDGMQAWPEDDVRAFEKEQRGEVVPPAYGTSTVDDEIFLLDGEGDEFIDLATADDDVEFAPADESAEDVVDDDLLVAGDDDRPAGAAWTPAEFRAVPDATAHEDEGTHGRPYDPLGDDQGADLLPDLFDDDPVDTGWEAGPVFGDDGLGVQEPEGPMLERDDEQEMPSSADAWLTLGDAPPPGAADADRLESAGEAAGDDEAAGHDVIDVPSIDPDSIDADLMAGGPAADGPSLEALGGDEAEATAAGNAAEAPEGSGSASEPSAPFAPIAAASSIASALPADGPEGLPLVSHGAVFRRQVDLSSLVAARADIARDLGLDEPVPAIAFFARAAAKALGGGGKVAVAVFDRGGVRTVPVEAASRPFADVVAAMSELSHGAGSDAGAFDLVVADLSDLELDEVVLHLAAPVLSIGRVLVDTASGGRRATLALSGDATGSESARILVRAADLLETPIRVVL